MNNFTSELIVKSITPTKWQLTGDFFYYFNESDKEKGILIPRNFITDFASSPRLLWSLVPPTGRYTKAAVLHDYLYSKDEELELNISRKQADKIFLNAMQVLGVKKWRAYAMYFAVRIFGFKAYKKNLK